MRTIEASATYQASPDQVWEVLCDLSRWPQWLVIHKEWKTDVPGSITRGDTATAAATVMNMPISVDWTCEQADPPRSLVMAGITRAGVTLALALDVRAGATDATTVAVTANIDGGMIDGPMGRVFQKSLVGALDKSLRNAEALIGAADRPRS